LFQFSELAPARGSSGRVHLPRFVLLPRPSPSHPNPPWRQGSLPNHLVQRCNSGPVPRFAYSFGPTETFRPSERASFPAAVRALPSATPCSYFAPERRIAPSGERYCPGTGCQPRSCTSEERRNRLQCSSWTLPSFGLTLSCAMPVRRSGLPLWRAYPRAFLTCNWALASRNTNGSPTSSGSHPNLKWNLALQCEHFGKSVTRTIRSESVNSHWSALIPAASAARAIKPRWRLLAKLWTCSTQMPVKLATSESVKIFWLDFTVTIALAPLLRRTSATLSLMLCVA